MFFALIVSMGIPGKVYAEESVSINETTPMEYKVTQGGVTPSNGAVEWSKQGDVVTIKLKGNLLGMITIAQGGNYILDANTFAIYPGEEFDNVIDGNFWLSDKFTLTLTGNGKYYAGELRFFYIPGSAHSETKICVENGMFQNNQNDENTKVSVIRTGNTNVEVVYYSKDGNNNESFGHKEITTYVDNRYGNSDSFRCYRYMVKQEVINDDDRNGLKNMLDPLQLSYYPNPTQSSNPGNPGQGGQNPSNPPTNPPSNPTNPGGNTTTGVSGTNYHSDETVVVIITEGEKYVKNVLAQLEKAPVNGKVIIDTKDWYCFNRTLAEKVTSMKEVDVTVKYGYQGKKYEVTIPAGSDIVSLLDENGFVGFRYLDAVFGGRKITE